MPTEGGQYVRTPPDTGWGAAFSPGVTVPLRPEGGVAFLRKKGKEVGPGWEHEGHQGQRPAAWRTGLEMGETGVAVSW